MWSAKKNISNDNVGLLKSLSYTHTHSNQPIIFRRSIFPKAKSKRESKKKMSTDWTLCLPYILMRTIESGEP